MSGTPKQTGSTVAAGKVWRAALLGGGLAAAGNLGILAVAGALGVRLQIPDAPGSATLAPLTPGPVIGASLIPALLAGALLVVLGRFLRDPWPAFLVIAALVLLLSFGAPLRLPIDQTAQWVLNLMHAVAGAAIVGALWKLARAL